MIKYVVGDVVDAPQPIIVHQCNAQGVMGSGVAKAIRDRYPHVYEAYGAWHDDWCAAKRKQMGLIQLVLIDNNREICNLIGQYHYVPRGQRHTDYEALAQGFEALRDLRKGDIAMPRIGCGLGGGDWRVVEALIESIFNDRDVYVYDLPLRGINDKDN